MSALRLRRAVRAVVLDEEDRVLLCRLAIPEPIGTVVWVTPGGGVKRGETPFAALRRELLEEVGLAVGTEPPHVWHQQVVGAEHAAGHDGVVNDYFLVRTASFHPRGAMSDDELAAEYIDGFRWWHLSDIAGTVWPNIRMPVRRLRAPMPWPTSRRRTVIPVRRRGVRGLLSPGPKPASFDPPQDL